MIVLCNLQHRFSFILAMRLGKKKGDLLVRQPHAMLRRLNSLKGIYPLLL